MTVPTGCLFADSIPYGGVSLEGVRSPLPLADGEAEWRAGPRGDLLRGRPELQRLRRVLPLQDQ